MPQLPESVNLTEVLGALSLATDLANGNPLETALRTSLVAAELARAVGADESQISDAFAASLLRSLGCTAFAHEEAHTLGDDLAAKQGFAAVELGSHLGVLAGLGNVNAPILKKARAALNGHRSLREMVEATCQVAVRLAERLKVRPEVRQALGQIYERWDGQGAPAGLKGEASQFSARVMHVATLAEVLHRHFGRQATIAELRRRSGRHLDPQLVRRCIAEATRHFAFFESPSVWDRLEEVAPKSGFAIDCSLEELAQVFADFVDLKSVYTLGHSPQVASLAEGAGQLLGLKEQECQHLRVAALLHDLGKAGVSTSTWEKRGKLTASEWERVRLHPYFTERVLARSPALAQVGALAGAHHERLDGSGYHRGSQGAGLPTAAMTLAAADIYQAQRESRPHRPAASDVAAAAALKAEARAGRLPKAVVLSVLEAAGHPHEKGRARWPAELSDREVEVLQLLARGAPTKEIAAKLSISPRTVQHHIIHIYEKTNVSSRAAAALFAVEHGLLQP